MSRFLVFLTVAAGILIGAGLGLYPFAIVFPYLLGAGLALCMHYFSNRWEQQP